MGKILRTALPLIALAVVVLLLLQQRSHNAVLVDQIAGIDRAMDQRSARLLTYERLVTADSLFHAGQYSQADAAYAELQNDSTFRLDGNGIQARRQHARQLTKALIALDTLRILEGRRTNSTVRTLPVNIPSAPLAPLPLERSRPSEYDSLTFALEKSQLQIRNLKGRLKLNSGGNYLTFDSGEGNEVYYVGDVRDGKAHGRGVALLSSGSRYIGEWRENRRHGEGTFRWSDGAFYEGSFYDDQRDGSGTYHFPNGEKFIGDWENDLRNGQGIFYSKDGEIVAQGMWEDDELVKQQ